MDDTNNVETVAEGGDQPAKPVTSPTPPTPPSAIDVEALKAVLRPIVAEELAKSDQSIKDKRIAKLQSKVDEFQDQFARFEILTNEGKMSREQALLSMRLEEALAKLGVIEPAAPAPTIPGSVGGQAVDETVSTFLKVVELDPNSAQVTEVLRQGGSPLDQITRLTKLAASQKAARQVEPNPAAVMPTGGGAPVVSDDVDSLTEKLIRLQQEPSKNMKEIIRLSAELKKLTNR